MRQKVFVVARRFIAAFLLMQGAAQAKMVPDRAEDALPLPVWVRTGKSSDAQPEFRDRHTSSATLTAIAVPMNVWTKEKLFVEAFTSGWLCPRFGPNTQQKVFRHKVETNGHLPRGTLLTFNEHFGLVRSVFVSETTPDGRAVVVCGNWSKGDDALMHVSMLWHLRTIVPQVLGAK